MITTLLLRLFVASMCRADVEALQTALPLLIYSVKSKMQDDAGDIAKVLAFGDNLLDRLGLPADVALAVKHRVSVV